jgi:Fe-S cluster assembly scaffold protein SufB
MNKGIERVFVNESGGRVVKVDLDKEGEERELLLVIMAEKKGDYRVGVEVNHLVSFSKSRVRIRAIAREGVNLVVEGIIKVNKKLEEIESNLEMRGLILDDGGRIEFKPNLEIESNKVKVSHAAVVSEIDEEQVFYLMNRGLSRDEAEKLIIKGFLGVE